MSVILFSILAIVFILCLFKNKHKAILWFGPASILAQDYMCIRYESPAISLLFLLESAILAVFFLFKRSSLSLKHFPLRKAFIFLFLTYIAGIIVSSRPFLETVPYVVSLICSYLIVVVFYNEISCKCDITTCFKSFIVITTVLSLYFLFEYTTQSNPFLAWILPQIPESWGGLFFYFEDPTTRFSSVMCQSLLNISIGWGGFCALGVSFLLICKREFLSLVNPIYFWFLILLLVFGVLGSGSRSALLYLLLIIAGFVFEMNGKNKLFFILFVLLGVIVLRHQLFEILGSLSGNDVGGSSVGGRQLQLLAAISVISQSPVFGFGIKGTAIAGEINSSILGSESIWLQQLINFGLFGVIYQIYMYKSMISELRSVSQNKRMAVVFVIGWILFSSATTSPGFGETYFLIIYTLLYKTNILRNV